VIGKLCSRSLDDRILSRGRVGAQDYAYDAQRRAPDLEVSATMVSATMVSAQRNA